MMFKKIHYTCMKLLVFIIIRMYTLKCIKGKEVNSQLGNTILYYISKW